VTRLAALLLCLPLAAHAEGTCSAPLADGSCPASATVTFPELDVEKLRALVVETQRTKDRCLVANDELAAKLLAAEQHVAALEAAPVPAASPWGYVAAGALGAAVVVGVLLIVH
jgi:cytochrome c-type biogenesis protein CcmH/NrfG